ncbi:unnamed protein product, partial [Medioppia subpectinata]
GGRGKGYFKNSSMKGGVQLTKDKQKVTEICAKMLNDFLITAQTTKSGVLVNKVMIGEALDIKKEFYLAILLDRASGGPVIVASQEGGVDIEQVAEKTPDAIHKFPIPIDSNAEDLDIELAKKVAKSGLGLSGNLAEDAAQQISRLYKMFIKLDALQVEINPFGITTKDSLVYALQVEINPFGITTKDSLVCFDAKINFDENASFRHQWMKQIENENSAEEDPRDRLARDYNLNFVPMDGNIACLVNGAGLAMATMDIIHHYGGSPANFLDVGGSVNQLGVENAFRLITADPKVRAILVNIFGGIVNCETIAKGLIAARSLVKVPLISTIAKGLIAARSLVKVPLIVRLEGTNSETARALLSEVSDIISATDLDDAAQKAVKSVTI